MQVSIKDISACSMGTAISHNAVVSFKAVCYTKTFAVFNMAASNINFINTVL